MHPHRTTLLAGALCTIVACGATTTRLPDDVEPVREELEDGWIRAQYPGIPIVLEIPPGTSSGYGLRGALVREEDGLRISTGYPLMEGARLTGHEQPFRVGVSGTASALCIPVPGTQGMELLTCVSAHCGSSEDRQCMDDAYRSLASVQTIPARVSHEARIGVRASSSRVDLRFVFLERDRLGPTFETPFGPPDLLYLTDDDSVVALRVRTSAGDRDLLASPTSEICDVDQAVLRAASEIPASSDRSATIRPASATASLDPRSSESDSLDVAHVAQVMVRATVCPGEDAQDETIDDLLRTLRVEVRRDDGTWSEPVGLD